MRLSKLMLMPLLASLAWASVSLAADDKPKKKSDDSGDEKPKKKGDKDKGDKDKGDKKDDKSGAKGVTPYTEKLLKGHKLVAARDFTGAVEAYRNAIAEDDKNPLGHYYLGAAQLLKGDFAEAEASWQNALRAPGGNEQIVAKVRFGLADLRERQRKLDDGKTAWQDYGKYIADHPKTQGYPATPGERQKTTEKWQDLEKKYGEVKKRIADRDRENKEKRANEAAKDAAEEEKKGGKKK